MSAVETGADLVRISEIAGAALPLESCRWPSDVSGANAHLLLLLAELCGRCELSGGGGYIERGTPETWLRLREVDQSAIAAVLRRIERSYPGWRLDAGHATTLLDRIDTHFATAQLRLQRERAA